MKKKKQSKKRWAWTEAQKRKTYRSKWMFNGSTPSSFTKEFNKIDEARAKVTVNKMLSLYDGTLESLDEIESIVFNYKYNYKGVGWWWW